MSGSETTPMWRTHHEPGSAEEAYSRSMRFGRYLAMQSLLMEIASLRESDPIGSLKQRAEDILAGRAVRGAL